MEPVSQLFKNHTSRPLDLTYGSNKFTNTFVFSHNTLSMALLNKREDLPYIVCFSTTAIKQVSPLRLDKARENYSVHTIKEFFIFIIPIQNKYTNIQLYLMHQLKYHRMKYSNPHVLDRTSFKHIHLTDKHYIYTYGMSLDNQLDIGMFKMKIC